MSRDSASKIHIKAFDDLFGGGEADNTNSEELLKDAVEIPLDELHPFKNHPFIVRDDDKLQEMVESIKKVGVLNPAIARKDPNGGYELISGHTRKEAAKRAGLATMPVIVRDYDDDMATIAMVDSNLQREEISISEKARAYAMKYEAMKHQGSSKGGVSLQALSEETGENYKTIQRLITVSKLPDDLLGLIDEKKLGIRQGIDLTELSENEQEMVYQEIIDNNLKISMNQASKLRDLSKDGLFDASSMKETLAETKKPKKTKDDKSKTSTGKRYSSISEEALYECFADAGILSYNNENDRYGIKMGNEWINTGFHCGDCLRVFINGYWVDTCMESSVDREWYLVGTECEGNLENIIAKC